MGYFRMASQCLQHMTNHKQFFTHLFSQHYQWLCGRVTRKLGCQQRAEDIAADTFLRVLGMKDLDRVQEPRALLSTIARRLMIDSWRRADLEKAYLETLVAEPGNCVATPEEHAIALDALLQLDLLLAGLAKQAKQVFIHSVFDGMTYEEVGCRLGISKSRVHQHMQSAYLCCMEALLQ